VSDDWRIGSFSVRDGGREGRMFRCCIAAHEDAGIIGANNVVARPPPLGLHSPVLIPAGA
jgi:hypothetical protein